MRRRRSKEREEQNMEIVVLDGALLEEGAHTRFWKTTLTSAAVLILFTLILTGCVVSAFSLSVHFLPLCGAVCLYALFFTWFLTEKRLDSRRLLLSLFFIFAYGMLLFVMQEAVIRSFYGVANAVIREVNRAYGGTLSMFSKGQGSTADAVVLAALFPLVWVLGYGICRKCRFLVVASVLFPLLSLASVMGGRPSAVFLYLLLLGIVAVIVAAGSVLPGWRASAAALFLAVLVSVPCFYLTGLLGACTPPALAKAGTRVEMRILQSLQQLLPKISRGRLKLSLDGIGGGVEDGTLGAVDGYYFSGIESLKVTSAKKPRETVYLRGFAGETYTGNSFEPGDADVFNSAASSWKTEGNASLYIWNLPFLRMMYYENFGESEAQDDVSGSEQEEKNGGDVQKNGQEQPSGELKVSANTFTVENLDANPAYTYVPYFSFLNDNYRIAGGDSFVEGQTIQQDIFSGYWRSQYRETMESYRDKEETPMVLNRTEASYRAYVNGHDLWVPREGLSRLKKECREKAEEERWMEDNDFEQPLWDRASEIEEIRRYVIRRLLSECEYELDADKLPEGEDFVEYFLYETHKGYSMHFAAAATMMFRLFGVPARYVVGYAAPKEMFVQDESGSYTAILEDNNAHAWTEVYDPFLGWMPVEVTPGMEAEFAQDIYMEETETESEVSKKEKTDAEVDAGGGVSVMLLAFAWITGHPKELTAAAALLILTLLILYVGRKLREDRRERFGYGLGAKEQIAAVYRSMYRLFVSYGMEADAGLLDGRVMDYMEERLSEVPVSDRKRLCQMVLQVHYGYETMDDADADWMLSMYRRMRRSLKKNGGRIK